MRTRAAAFVKMARPGNVLMVCAAVPLGYWLAGSGLGLRALALLILSAACATAFGNTINDLHDIRSDRVSHPNRPLARGDLSARAAQVCAALFAAASLGLGFAVSVTHGLATLVPVLLLTVYTLLLKGTKLWGNITVAALVAYPLLYGALGGPAVSRLMIPAVLAFFLNLSREIVKDIQDEQGDRLACVTTSAALAKPVLRRLLLGLSAVYLLLLFTPTILGQFGLVYAATCAAAALPLHGLRLRALFSPDWPACCGRLSVLTKMEMLAGLAALALDKALLG